MNRNNIKNKYLNNIFKIKKNNEIVLKRRIKIIIKE